MNRIESTFKADYAKTNIDLIVNKLNANSCLTIISPSGFGKSYLLRYLAYNRKYRRRYRALRNVEFVYIDAHEIGLEKDNVSSQTWVPNNAREMEAVGKVFYRNIIQKINELEHSKEKFPEAPYTKDNLLRVLEYLLNKDLRRKVFFIIDGTETLFTFNREILGDFLQHLRDNNRSKLEFIFTLDRPSWLENPADKPLDRLAILLSQQVIVHTLASLQECYIFPTEGFRRIFDEIVTSRTSGFKKKVQRIDQLSGGYLPYAKYFYAKEDLYSNLKLTDELKNTSSRLLQCLSSEQVSILSSINLGKPIVKNSDSDYLLKTGLLKVTNGRYAVFSPVMSAYLKTSP